MDADDGSMAGPASTSNAFGKSWTSLARKTLMSSLPAMTCGLVVVAGWELLDRGHDGQSLMRHGGQSWTPLGCVGRWSLGQCWTEPMRMAQDCPRTCGEHLVHAPPRGRHLLEGVVPKEDAAALLELVKQAGVVGDGYGGRKRALSPLEEFYGVEPVAAARWARRQPEAGGLRQRAMELVRLLVKQTKAVTERVEDAFHVRRGSLAYDFIHLTCRRHDRHQPASRSGGFDSHKAHADNCYFEGATKCIRDKPMYWWRSHTAILSLNGADTGDFTGGDFFYEPWPDAQRVKMAPKAGSVAAFTAGSENIHGVEAVTNGTRCQLSLWYTDDLQRAAHGSQLEAAENVLNGKVGNTQAAHNADEAFGSQCQRAVEARAGAGAITSGKVVATLELPGENHSMEVELLSDLPGPQISKIRGLITRSEMDHIIQKAAPNFKAAVVFEGGSITTANYRTSTSSWIRDDKNDEIISRVLNRIKMVTGLSLLSAEELQVAHYVDTNQGRYDAHLDWGTNGRVTRNFGLTRTREPMGARIATLLIYLNDVERGGHTVFVDRNVTVSPEAGSGLFFYNLHPSATGDEQVLHGACPVLQGEKMIMTKWIHELGNEALFDAGADQKRFARDWTRLAESLRGTTMHKEPLILGKSCETLRAAGECSSNPLRMARACLGHCEEYLIESKVRDRQLFEGIISSDAAKDILQLTKSSAMLVGDGYGGQRRPLSIRETFSGLRPVAAARWAVSLPRADGQQATAVRWVRNFVAAAAAMQKAVAHVPRLSNRLLIDNVHLACRSAAKIPYTADIGAEEIFDMQNLSISAGSDLAVEFMTITEARAKCLAMEACQGFTFRGPPTEKPVHIYMKSKQDMYGAGYGWTSYLRRVEPEIPDSHAPHADNCYKSDRSCIAGHPRLFWRERSATLFLHGPESGDFSGGFFFYSPSWESSPTERLRVAPRPGRMVAFAAGAANIHGVEEVTEGTRCAISAWFTSNAERATAARSLEMAEDILNAAVE